MTIFSKIIAGEIPSYKIAENDKFYAFLDINPVNWGHTLVVPKEETDYIFDIDDAQLGEMMVFAKHVAAGIKKAIPCRKVGVAVLGLRCLMPTYISSPFRMRVIWISRTRLRILLRRRCRRYARQ